jgi:hypothetical protein
VYNLKTRVFLIPGVLFFTAIEGRNKESIYKVFITISFLLGGTIKAVFNSKIIYSSLTSGISCLFV